MGFGFLKASLFHRFIKFVLFNSGETLRYLFAIHEVGHFSFLALKHQAHGQEYIALPAYFKHLLTLAASDFEYPFLEESLNFEIMKVDFGTFKPFTF